MKRIAITGGRDYADASALNLALDEAHTTYGITALAHGNADGADTLAEAWANAHDLPTTSFTADWDRWKKAAGPLRNAKMLDDFKPHYLIAFPGGKGTLDCVTKARARGVPVLFAIDGTLQRSPTAAAAR